LFQKLTIAAFFLSLRTKDIKLLVSSECLSNLTIAIRIWISSIPKTILLKNEDNEEYDDSISFYVPQFYIPYNDMDLS